MKYRVHVLMSLVVEAYDADQAKHLAYREMEQVSQIEAQLRPTLRVVSVWDAEEKKEQPRPR
jgi:hypothetical protein